MAQLPLFDAPAPAPRRDGDAHADGSPARDDRFESALEEAASLARRVPPEVRFGTSSWSFPGWAGLVYRHRRTAAALARDGLREYARHPLMRTVGIDRSYYAPVPEADLARYAGQLPDGFPCCTKAPAAVTSPIVPGPERGAAIPNPTFLSADRLMAELIEPFARAFRGHAGPFLIEISPTPRGAALDPVRFAEQLDRCLEALPREFEYAVELRDRRLLTAVYRSVLARHRAAHVYNYWSGMPPPGAQAALQPVEDNACLVVRLLLRPGTRYEQQRSQFAPFDRIVEPDPAMRDDVVTLLERAVQLRRRAYVLVNNKAEGSAPLTIRALAQQLAPRVAGRGNEGDGS